VPPKPCLAMLGRGDATEAEFAAQRLVPPGSGHYLIFDPSAVSLRDVRNPPSIAMDTR
jgi:hypothetical protein